MIAYIRQHCSEREACICGANGLLFAGLLSIAAAQIADWPFLATLGISPLIIGMMVGMLYGNTLRGHLPDAWHPGLVFASKHLLRFAIVLYGFRVTFQQIGDIGMVGLAIDAGIVAGLLIGGTYIGRRFLGLDSQTAVLVSAGSAICGAAAVLAAEPVVRAENHKAVVAVATVVLFGTLAMFAYPIVLTHIDLTDKQMGLIIGSTVHEVAQVVAAGDAISPEVSDTAVVVKMTRVLLLIPALMLLSLWWATRKEESAEAGGKTKFLVPWFAFMFLAAVGVNSTGVLSQNVTESIVTLDTFMLTMAMTAVGMETRFSSLKQAGIRPFMLGGALFAMLLMSAVFTAWVTK